ncbi:unnamed protein product, partial [Rotaria sp. Silwood2]
YEGETVQLHCLTQPGSTVQWLHNNEVINSNLMRRYEMLSSGGSMKSKYSVHFFNNNHFL